jgi:hypothetical protein
MTNAATYVYCLVSAPRRPPLARLPKGLPGSGRVRLVGVARGLWLVATDVPLARYGEAALALGLSDLDWVARAAVAHEAVVERFRRAPAVLPMKLFTMFASDERAVADVAARLPRIRALLARVKNQDEWGVRLSMPPRVAPRTARASRAATALTGATYLSGKKAVRDRAAELVRRGSEEANALFDRLASVASSARRRSATEVTAGNGALLLDAALLVPRSRARSFQRSVARDSRRLAALGYRVALTGPWAPYSFMEE